MHSNENYGQETGTSTISSGNNKENQLTNRGSLMGESLTLEKELLDDMGRITDYFTNVQKIVSQKIKWNTLLKMGMVATLSYLPPFLLWGYNYYYNFSTGPTIPSSYDDPIPMLFFPEATATSLINDRVPTIFQVEPSTSSYPNTMPSISQVALNPTASFNNIAIYKIAWIGSSACLGAGITVYQYGDLLSAASKAAVGLQEIIAEVQTAFEQAEKNPSDANQIHYAKIALVKLFKEVSTVIHKMSTKLFHHCFPKEAKEDIGRLLGEIKQKIEAATARESDDKKHKQYLIQLKPYIHEMLSKIQPKLCNPGSVKNF
ncbi:hypothetical protein [Candidatus Cardinium hertigii]|nr:hypothetical protein [Candidatus Cardinium hertigii]